MSEKKVGKRLLTWVLVLVMTLSLLPLNVLAANPAVMRIVRPDTDKYITYNFYLTDEEKAEPYDSQIIKSGDSLTAPATPEKEGYQFTGWFYQNGTEFTAFGTAISVTEDSTDVNLYAKFVPVCYVYFMDGNGSDARIIATETLTPEGSLSSEDFNRAKLLVPVSAEQAVIGWTKDGQQVDIVSYVEGGSIYLYPIIANGHWITFESDGGSYVEPQFVTDTTKEPTPPTKPGYDFAGWYDGDTKFSFGGTLDSNKDLTAHWTEKKDVQYTVIHRLENADDDGYSYKESERLTGTAGELTEDAVDKSYEGFTLEKVEQKEIAGDGSTIVNVYYKRNMYTVTFVSDGRGNDIICGKEAHEHTYTDYKWELFSGYKYKGGCYPSDKYSRTPICGKEEHTHDRPDCYGILLKNLTITAKYGANISDKWPTYNGSSTWKTSKNGDTYQVNIDTMPLGGATFYGPLTGNGSETAYYYVESLSGGNYELHHSDTSPGTGYNVTKEDQYPITGFTYADGTRIGKSYNNAKFYYTRNSYDIVYVNSGAEDDKTTVSYKFEASISDAGNYKPTTTPAGKEGYKFAGWYADPAGEQEYVFTGKTMPAQNITVYAHWVAPVHTVTFKVEGQEDTTSQVTHESTVTLPENPKSPDSTEDFLGWTYQDGKPFNPDTKITDDLKLYAKFGSKVGYTVTYDTTGGNGTSVPDDNHYGKGAAATVLNGANTALPNMVFLYWKDDAGTKYYPNNKVTINGDVTLTAVYGDKAETLTLTYNANFGTPPASKQISGLKNNDLIDLLSYDELELPKRDGYTFTGWNTQQDGHGISFAAGTSAARVDKVEPNVLYAQWKKTTIDDEVIVTIKGKTSTATYDGQPHAVNGYDIVSIIGNAGYTQADVSLKSEAQNKYNITQTNAGTYTMALDASDFVNTNDKFTDVEFVIAEVGQLKLTINKRNVTLTSASASKVYDGTALTKPEVTVTGDGFVTGEVADIKATGTITDFGEVTNTITYNEGANFKADNYEITTTEGKLTITKRSVTLTSASDSKVYDGTALTKPEVTVTGSFVDGEVTDIKATGTITDVGTVTNTITFAKGEKFKDSNYAITKTEGTLEVTPITDKVTVTIKGNTKTVYYNGKEQSVKGYTVSIDNNLYKEADFALKNDAKAEAKGTKVDTYPMGLTKESFENTNKNFTNVVFVVNDGYLEITRSGGHHPRPKPTVEIEDDDALGLNTTDHFAYIVGYGNGEVRPQNNITRAEVATIFFRLLTDDVRDENLTKTNRYSDVTRADWYNTAVSTLSSMGIITGYPDGTFRPNAAITRAEFAAIAARFDSNGDKTTAKFSDIANHWAKDEISIAYNNGWITGYPDGTFGPQRDITRAETMTLVNRVLNRQPETEDDLLPNMTVWTDNANPNAWYYLAVQEATNSHYYKFKTNSKYEKWTELRETRDWTQLEK